MTGFYRLAGTTLGPEDSMQRALQTTVEYLIAKHKISEDGSMFFTDKFRLE